MKLKLILASSSIGRKKLLDYFKLPYQIFPVHLDEEKIITTTPVETIRLRARLKAERVAQQVSRKHLNHACLIISADTEIIINNQLIGKPKDEQDAFRIFHLLSGKTHEVITATYIIKISSPKYSPQVILNDVDKSWVTLKKLNDEDISIYLQLTNYTHFCGGYALISAQNFITRVEGSLSNVIGLPLEKVIPVLKKYQILPS